MPYSSLGRPATALSAAVSMTTVPNVQTSLPSSLRRSLGARSRYVAGRWLTNRSGGSIRWSSTLTRMRSSTSSMASPHENGSAGSDPSMRTWFPIMRATLAVGCGDSPAARRDVDDDLADGATPGDVAQSVGRLLERERGADVRVGVPGHEQLGQFRLVAGELVGGVHHEVPELEPQHLHALQEYEVEGDAGDRPRGEADRHEPAAPPQRPQRRLRQVAAH